MVHDEMHGRTTCATGKTLTDVLGGRDIEGGTLVCMERA